MRLVANMTCSISCVEEFPWINVTEGFYALDLMDLTPIAHFSINDPWIVRRYPYADPPKNQVQQILFPLFCPTECTYGPPH